MDPKIIKNLGTNYETTWCPACPNYMILASVKNALGKLIESKKYKQNDFAITTDIGCSSKIFDYLNLSGIYGLHGRALPTGIGLKLGNPNLHVLTFVGDGGMYEEGISHFIHSFRYNTKMTLIVHNNQSFSLTTGQPTATSQQGFKAKSEPLGVFDKPLNPIKLALASGGTFIARCNANDIKHTAEIIEKAINHNGFSYVEIIQDCLIFNKEANKKDEHMYKIEDNFDMKKAEEIASEYDYNNKTGKIPLGVIYQVDRKTLEEEWPMLIKLKKQGTSWKGLKR
ncbi:2-oxoacid:ferredoxin oxidoreductase subunit beta [Candidatus Pacearchaeota archaeon]|nr:2-oxoacid:ferredoxin oxidoreductase subunit beta [Candidatus Pacearchaeota archaeon]